MVAPKQEVIPFYRGICQKRGRGFGALAQGIGRTAIAFLCYYFVPAAKRIDADLLETAAPEVAKVVSGQKKLKTAAKSVGRQALRKQLGTGSRKRTASKVIRYSNKSCKTNQSVAKRRCYKHISFMISRSFRYHLFVAVSGNLVAKVPVVDDVLLSHEQKIYLITWIDEIYIEFQTDRTLYVDLRQTYLVLKLKFVKGWV